MKPKLIVLLLLIIAAFALGMYSAVQNWDIVCPVSLVFVAIFAILYILDDPEMLSYCNYSLPYHLYFP